MCVDVLVHSPIDHCDESESKWEKNVDRATTEASLMFERDKLKFLTKIVT